MSYRRVEVNDQGKMLEETPDKDASKDESDISIVGIRSQDLRAYVESLEAKQVPSEDAGVVALLKHVGEREKMLQASKEVYQEELVLFWIAVHGFGQHCDLMPRSQLEDIYDKFIRSGAPNEITLSLEERNYWEGRLTDVHVAKDQHFFDELMDIINKRIELYVLPKYIENRHSQGHELGDNFAELAKKKAHEISMLEQLLVEPSNFIVFYALCKTFLIKHTDHNSANEASFIGGVNEILIAHEAMLPFLEFVMSQEVETHVDRTTLLRERTVVTLLWGDLCKRQESVSYATQLIGDLFIAADVCGSLNPSTHADAMSICHFADLLLNNVRSNLAACPKTLRRLFRLVSDSTSIRHPDLRYPIVGNFLFLRWLNPSLLQPEKYGLLADPLPSDVRKNLTIVAKLLQHACNPGDNSFDDDSPGSAYLNGWLTRNSLRFQTLFANLILTEQEGEEEGEGTDLRTPRSGFVSPRARGESASPRSPRQKETRGRSVSTPTYVIGGRRNVAKARLKSRALALKRVTGNNRKLGGKVLSARESQLVCEIVLDMLVKYEQEVEEIVLNFGSADSKQKWHWLQSLLQSYRSLSQFSDVLGGGNLS